MQVHRLAYLSPLITLLQKYLEALHQVAFYNTSVALLEKELEVIGAVLGGKMLVAICISIMKRIKDDIGAQQPHAFKSSAFSIPTTCEYCHVSITQRGKIYFDYLLVIDLGPC